MTTRTCILCKHIRWMPSTSGWSEYTPGDDAEMSCAKGRFNERFNLIDTLEEYRNILTMANTCTHYEEIDVPPVANGNFQIPS